MYTCPPVREVGIEVEESVIKTVKGIVDEIDADDAKVGKSTRFPIIVEAVIANPRKVKLDAIIPRVFSGSIILIEPSSAEVLKIPCPVKNSYRSFET